jgi:flagellar biosynthesis protein FliQ
MDTVETSSTDEAPRRAFSLPIDLTVGIVLIAGALSFLASLVASSTAAVVILFWYSAFLPTLATALGHFIARKTSGSNEPYPVSKTVLFSLLISLFAFPLWILYYAALLVVTIVLGIRIASFRATGRHGDPSMSFVPYGMLVPSAVMFLAVLVSPAADWGGITLFLSGLGTTWALAGLEMILLARSVWGSPPLNRWPIFIAIGTSVLATILILVAPVIGIRSGDTLWTDLLGTTVIAPGALGLAHLWVAIAAARLGTPDRA